MKIKCLPGNKIKDFGTIDVFFHFTDQKNNVQ